MKGKKDTSTATNYKGHLEWINSHTKPFSVSNQPNLMISSKIKKKKKKGLYFL